MYLYQDNFTRDYKVYNDEQVDYRGYMTFCEEVDTIQDARNYVEVEKSLFGKNFKLYIGD